MPSVRVSGVRIWEAWVVFWGTTLRKAGLGGGTRRRLRVAFGL